MEVGQVGFNNEKAVRITKVQKKITDIVNRLERTRVEKILIYKFIKKNVMQKNEGKRKL